MEKALLIFKPDCRAKKLEGKSLARLQELNLEIIGMKMMQLSDEVLKEHYAHIYDKPFYPELRDYMTRMPVILMAVKAENLVTRVRDLLGPTNSEVAPKGTIRGDWGKDITENILHASDSAENGEIEVKRFFKAEEIFE